MTEKEAKDFTEFEKELREQLGREAIFLSELDAFGFGDVLFDKNFQHREYEDIVPRDSAYDCIMNFIDFKSPKKDTDRIIGFERHLASVQFVEDTDMVKLKVAVGYITFRKPA